MKKVRKARRRTTHNREAAWTHFMPAMAGNPKIVRNIQVCENSLER